jgi:hypothetical protein|tara:strand:+ start:1288 stop:1452 length:165 start_codon:yes stop_codon:yes gene_type:complete
MLGGVNAEVECSGYLTPIPGKSLNQRGLLFKGFYRTYGCEQTALALPSFAESQD